MQAREPDVGGRECVAWSGPLEHGARLLIVGPRYDGLRLLPVRAPEEDAVLGGLDFFTGAFEQRNSLVEEPLGTARIAGTQVSPTRLAQEPGSGQVVADVREQPVVQVGRLVIGLVRLCLLGGSDADWHRVLPPVGGQQVEGEVDRRGTFLFGERIRGETVELLALRRDHVLVDRLARQRVAEPVTAVVVRFLFDELLLHARVKSGLHASIVLGGNGQQQRIAERPAEHRCGLQHVRLLGRKLLHP